MRWMLNYRTATGTLDDALFCDIIECDEEVLLAALAGSEHIAFDSLVEFEDGGEDRQRLIVPRDNIHSIRSIPEIPEQPLNKLGPRLKV